MEEFFHIRNVFPALPGADGTLPAADFIKRFYNLANFNPELISLISNRLGLLFDAQNEPGNLCFANNNDDLRDEFKQVFSKRDLCDYILGSVSQSALQNDLRYNDFLQWNIPVPKDSDHFWFRVRRGAEKRVGLLT